MKDFENIKSKAAEQSRHETFPGTVQSNDHHVQVRSDKDEYLKKSEVSLEDYFSKLARSLESIAKDVGSYR